MYFFIIHTPQLNSFNHTLHLYNVDLFNHVDKLCEIKYTSGTVNSNTVNSKFHLIRSFCQSLPDSYHFMFKMHG